MICFFTREKLNTTKRQHRGNVKTYKIIVVIKLIDVKQLFDASNIKVERFEHFETAKFTLI